jgi:hypothetical protein
LKGQRALEEKELLEIGGYENVWKLFWRKFPCKLMAMVYKDLC